MKYSRRLRVSAICLASDPKWLYRLFGFVKWTNTLPVKPLVFTEISFILETDRSVTHVVWLHNELYAQTSEKILAVRKAFGAVA